MSFDDYEPLPEVTAAEVPDGAFLLDVREPDEWAAGHVPGSAHLPIREVMSRLDEVPDDRQVVVVCRSGARSARVTAYLAQTGRDAVNLDGGLEAWAEIGRPLVADDGTPGYVA